MLITIRALLDGAAFATRLGDSASAQRYRTVAKEIEDSLGRFWDADRGYLLSTIESLQITNHDKIAWLDTGARADAQQRYWLTIPLLTKKPSGTVLGFNHAGTPSASDDWLGGDRSLATVHATGMSMRELYSLNRRHYPSSEGHLGYAVGRYPEDSYDGNGKIKNYQGNPWYLCTLAHAEFYYRLIPYFAQKTIEINSTNKAFFLELGYFSASSSAEMELLERGQSYPVGSKEHVDILKAFRDKGDAFVSVVRDWACWNGGMWEQFGRDNGREMGASHLT